MQFICCQVLRVENIKIRVYTFGELAKGEIVNDILNFLFSEGKKLPKNVFHREFGQNKGDHRIITKRVKCREKDLKAFMKSLLEKEANK